MNASQHLDAARQTLLSQVADFIGDRKISETTFGRLAVNDGKFVARLRSGDNMTTALIARAQSFIEDERAKARAAA